MKKIVLLLLVTLIKVNASHAWLPSYVSRPPGDFLFLERNLSPQSFSFHWTGKNNNSYFKLVEFGKLFGSNSPFRQLVAKVSNKMDNDDDIHLSCQLLEIINEEIEDPHESLLITGEILTKVLAYRNLQVGQSILIPVIEDDGQTEKVEFVVDRVFDLWQGMPAFGLIPKEENKAAPILLFRGTDLSLATKKSLCSLLSDLDLSGPGHTVYLHARPIIREWLNEMALLGQKARVMGFSLGGAFASYTLVYEADLLSSDKNNPSLAFNTPGVTKKLFNLWNTISKRPSFTIFQIQYDPVGKIGHLIGDVVTLGLDKPIAPAKAHLLLISAQPSYYIGTKEKENKVDLFSSN